MQEALTILVSKMMVYPAQDEDTVEKALPATTRLNRKLCEQALYSDQVSILASPVTGGGIGLGRVDKLFMLARAHGAPKMEHAARFVIDTLKLSGQRLLLKDGKLPDTPEVELEEAVRVGTAFENLFVPILKSLRIEC